MNTGTEVMRKIIRYTVIFESPLSLFLAKVKSWPFSQHVIFNNKNKNNHEMPEYNLPGPP